MQSLRTFLTSQRGAMFGMDARVALSIFGTLALLGGYTMLGRIETAKTGKFIKELITISDGLAALQADLGAPVTVDNYAFNIADPQDVFSGLRVNMGTTKKWSGPYINENYPDTHPVYGLWTSQAGQDDIVTGCGYGQNCYLWLSLSNFPEATFDQINDVIDENGGDTAEASPATEGRVRFSGTGTGTFSFRAIGWDPVRGRTVK